MMALLLLALQDPLELFEKRIRPLLAQECYACHSEAGKRKGGLLLDTRDGLRKGGRSGPAIVPGDPSTGLLLRSIRHVDPELKMPDKGAKLDDAAIRDIETWIRLGAPDPRDRPPSKEDVERDTAFPAVLVRRRRWWSFEPLLEPAVPAVKDAAWPRTDVDRLLLSRLEAEGRAPAEDVDARALLRRLSFVLTGLPPTPAELEAFSETPDVEAAADRLLASPAFGERWARHWMDWLRYAETHGSEGDPAIPFAWRWRDYLIRALNADVPVPQLVREQIAGDLLEAPRTRDGLNESALGPAHFRMVLHGFTPTDARDELATFTDNQIDTVTKAFLGLTVACARCHDHKFDAISQADFTALYGIFASSRPATIDLNLPERRRAGIAAFETAKAALRGALGAHWEQAVDAALDKLAAAPPEILKRSDAFAAWARGPAGWTKLREEEDVRATALEAFRARGSRLAFRHDGPSLDPAPAGAFHVPHEGERAIDGPYPAGAYSHLYSTRHRGVLHSAPFRAEGGRLFVRARGGGKARARYVVANYPRTGLIYPKNELNSVTEQWISWPLDYWKGDDVHVELATDLDQPVEHGGAERSWFGAAEAVYAPDGAAPPLPPCGLTRFGGDGADLRQAYAAALRRCIAAWRAGRMSDLEAEFLAAFVRQGFLPNRLAELPPELVDRVKEIRALEPALASPTRAPGLLEGFAADAPLFVRGDPKQPAARVPRRFLEAIDATPYGPGTSRSGRRELAESFVANPLFPRVFANRAWHHVFGTGLAGTPDNLGRLGETPAQPELLDHLARRFLAEGGSLKKLVRRLVVSRAFRQAGRPRRLEAEAIRDSLLFLTGKLDRSEGGPPVDGGSYRRSVYLRVQRNNLDPFLGAFDAPVPSSSRGKRDATNVPAQALALMNSPQVAKWAVDWSKRAGSETDAPARVRRLFLEAFGRPPSDGELQDSLAFLGTSNLDALAHALLNAKEFIYVR